MNYKIIATTKNSTPSPLRARASKQELSKALAKTTTQTIQEFQTAPPPILRANFILLSRMHEQSTDPEEKKQLDILMAKAITERTESDPQQITLRGTLISPIWIPETEIEKEAVANFMAQQMTAMNKAAFIAFAQPNILEQTLQAASDKKVPAPEQELDIKTLYNKVNFTIVSQILSHPTRESRLETFRLFENVMDRHLREGDFASAFQIYTALSHASVQRLSNIKAYLKTEGDTPYKTADKEIFNPTNNFRALQIEMDKHTANPQMIPMIALWFGHLDNAISFSKEHTALLNKEPLLPPLLKQQERLSKVPTLSPCTENIQDLFSNVLHVIQDTDISPEVVMKQTSEALTNFSHTMETPAKPLPPKKLSQAEIDFAYTETKTRILEMGTNSPTATPTATPPLMRKTMSRIISGIWVQNPVFHGAERHVHFNKTVIYHEDLGHPESSK